MKEDKLNLSDRLAIERTHLANERTFLAFFRSSVFFLGTGISILHINFFEDIPFLGWGFVVLSPMMFLFGLYRLVSVRRFIKKTIQKS
ncbi:MAG: hypothetical protein COB12_10585 [Flavobacterium sp.]|nr:MAG: hypothetical protein COB12_10585 [Flavobacterium sp.]